MKSHLQQLAECSRRYGRDHKFVFLGGGNTSCKDEETLFVKPSGVALKNIKAEDFIRLDRTALRRVFSAKMPADPAGREAAVKNLIAAAACPSGQGRASVEAPLHELLPHRFVVHTHPVMVNGMTCGKKGGEKCAELFPEALWIDYADPGYSLAMAVRRKIKRATAAGGSVPAMIFLQNHGVFIAADTVAEIDRMYAEVLQRLQVFYRRAGVALELPTEPAEPVAALDLAPRLRGICRAANIGSTVVTGERYAVAEGPVTPDHVVYAKSFPFLDAKLRLDSVESWRERHGYGPKIFAFPGVSVFTVGFAAQEAQDLQVVARNAAEVVHLSRAFGGIRYLREREYRFIEGWEAESYRSRVVVAAGDAQAGRLTGRVCLVTGAAQGFGLGIARGLLAENAIVGLADLNLPGAEEAARDLGRESGAPERVFAVKVDVSEESSVVAMIDHIIRRFGGLDLLVANAGVLRAGSVKEMSIEDWELVTKVNYTGYFLCAKHAARLMARQNRAGEKRLWTDIIQVSSKSGLEGSSRNGAYAGSKFGGIGLTQSFAKELVEDMIKVNSVCPGNYFEGPLWSDPENGLFVQYLDAGKVPGANTIDEVRRYYEGRVPMGRGCRPEDVVKAILYLVEQTYETGQALPVGGGQVMLH